MRPKTEAKEELVSYLNSIVLGLLFALFVGFPAVFLTITTDFFNLPKQALLGAVVLIAIVVFVIKTVIKGSLRLKVTFFDFSITLLIAGMLLSSLFSLNKFDSLAAFVPFFFAALCFFVIVNFVRTKKSFRLLTISLFAGASIASVITILSFLKIYILPIPQINIQTFTPLGSLLDQSIYFTILIPVLIFLLTKKNHDQQTTRIDSLEPQNQKKPTALAAISTLLIILIIGLLITIYQLFNPIPGSQKLTILPFQTGFQTGFAAISQDSQRSIQGFLFGSGYGTYQTDFTRFKQNTINQNNDLWSLVFVRSSSFALELLATAGILGISAFIFLTVRIVKATIAKNVFSTNPISISLLLSLIALFIFPVGFTVQVLFFILLGLFSVWQGFRREEEKKFFEVELELVALKKGLFSFETYTSPYGGSSSNLKKASLILPMIVGFVALGITGVLGFFSTRYIISDIEFQNSLVLASQNKAQETYQKQNNAIVIFPYRDLYYRVFSQTNLALANSLAIQQNQESSPSAEIQNTINTLIQQSINSARSATSISPLNTLNWQNLSSVYRSLIGFGQNAENFAIVTQQQAILLDPNNPQGYVNLGGIYYQLGLWDNAQNQFQIAISLKPDFANGHYNLGHALENKGDLQNALREYEAVKNLVANDPNSLALITSEIEAIKGKIEEGASAQISPQAPEVESTLNLSSPSAQLPAQNPPVEIPPPDTATESSR
ncbi:MAG: hypothetical protein A2687_04665 [Candidatus Levybacteria bacterium RIFCSPHIGHO2_01_FULL_38_26]|nr:MAG: hypothetical protein A2687_04665 [Candidatus Levybacteria bacterium RIFCSPHIGHO2_01_FULL_38_26]